MIYIRYRWGYLSVRVSEGPTEDVFEAVRGEEIFGKELGDDLDGTISLEQVKEAVGPLVQWEEVEHV